MWQQVEWAEEEGDDEEKKDMEGNKGTEVEDKGEDEQGDNP